jgi:hypothetical protein
MVTRLALRGNETLVTSLLASGRGHVGVSEQPQIRRRGHLENSVAITEISRYDISMLQRLRELTVQ